MTMITTLRVAVTLAATVAAVLVGWWLWDFYMLSPWTRDARVLANTGMIAPDVSGLITTINVVDQTSTKLMISTTATTSGKPVKLIATSPAFVATDRGPIAMELVASACAPWVASPPIATESTPLATVLTPNAVA